MLNKIILVAGLLASLMANSAWAGEHGAADGSGSGTDRASACYMAKTQADARTPTPSTITGHSSCDCSENKSAGVWTCTVDTYWEKR